MLKCKKIYNELSFLLKVSNKGGGRSSKEAICHQHMAPPLFSWNLGVSL